MLDKLTALLYLSKSGAWSVVMGDLPDADSLAKLTAMSQPKPAARKFGRGMALTAPLPMGGWHFWIMSSVPGVSELPALMTRIQDLSKGIARHGMPTDAGGPPARVDTDIVAQILNKVTTRISGAKRLKPKTLVPVLLDTLIELDVVESATIVHWKGRKKPAVWLSDERLYGRTDELRAIAAILQKDEPRDAHFEANTPHDDAVELAVLTRNLGYETASVALPATKTEGYGIVAFGDRPVNAPVLRAIIDMIELRFSSAPAKLSTLRTVRRLGLAVASVAAAIFLVQPAPIILTTVGTTVAEDITLVTLPSDAFLSQMHVRIGDRVSEGDLLAEFRSRTIDDALAEERLAASIEQLTAQAAFAENDISTFQLANQRLEIVQARIAQLIERQQELRMTAPVSGQVISAMSSNVAGLFGTTGQEVAQLQTTDAMRVTMELSRLDARMVAPKMAGTAYFRGLTQKTFDVEVLSPPSVSIDANSGAERIVTTARVANPEGLIVGMTGFLRLNGSVAPRIVGYSRYVAEFVREKSWTYLGLQL